MTLRELKEIIECIDTRYPYVYAYRDMYNAVTEYSNESQDWDIDEYVFSDERIIDYDLAEELAKNELDHGGLVRLWYFMGDCDFTEDLFYLNAYGNLEPVTQDTLENVRNEILEAIDEKLEDEEDFGEDEI